MTLYKPTPAIDGKVDAASGVYIRNENDGFQDISDQFTEAFFNPETQLCDYCKGPRLLHVYQHAVVDDQQQIVAVGYFKDGDLTKPPQICWVRSGWEIEEN